MLLEFATQVEQFREFFESPDYDTNLAQQVLPDGRPARQADLDQLEHNKCLSREAVRTAKRIYGKHWREHVYK